MDSQRIILFMPSRSSRELKFISSPIFFFRCPKIRQNLRLKHRIKSLDTLNFDDDRILYYQVQSVFPESSPLVRDWNWTLSPMRQAKLRKLNAKRLFVSRFQKPRPKNTMHLDSASYNFFPEMV